MVPSLSVHPQDQKMCLFSKHNNKLSPKFVSLEGGLPGLPTSSVFRENFWNRYKKTFILVISVKREKSQQWKDMYLIK